MLNVKKNLSNQNESQRRKNKRLNITQALKIQFKKKKTHHQKSKANCYLGKNISKIHDKQNVTVFKISRCLTNQQGKE